MDSRAQVAIERLVTGDKCDAKGCYELAVWLVSFNNENSHWCPKHTRMEMRDATRWGKLVSPKIDS